MLAQAIAGALVFTVAAGTMHVAHLRLMRVKPAVKQTSSKERPKLALPPLAALRPMALGYDNLMADIFWLQAIQWFGTSGREVPDLYPLFRAITWLDPRFQYAYVFGSYALADEGVAASHAVALLRFGIQQNPDDWVLRAQLGFIYYFYAKQYKAAADAYREAGEHGAPLPMKRLAAILYARGGSVGLSRQLWRGIQQSCGGDKVCVRRADHHLAELDVEEQLDALVAALRSFRKARGRLPGSLQELGAPSRDPLGRPYRYDPVAGTVAAQKLPWDPKWKEIKRERRA